VTLMIDSPANDAALIAFVESWDGREARNPRGSMGV
jgi:hypothetical protein